MTQLRLAAAVAAALLLCWAGMRGPAAVRSVSRLERENAVAPAHARSAPAKPAPAASGELPPPEPVLQQSAQRRFSSPAAGAAGTIAGAENPEERTIDGERRYAGSASAALPGGYGAPSASAGSFPAVVSGGAAPERGTPAAAKSGAPGGKGQGGGPPDEALGDSKLTGAAASLVGAAHDPKTRGDAAAMRAAASPKATLLRQLELDRKVDDGIRKGISDLQASGKPVTPEAVAKISEGVMIENGLDPADSDMGAAMARAMGPPPPNIPPAAYAAAVEAIASSPPLDPAVRAELERLADKPPRPTAPPPRGAMDAFRKHTEVFDKALEDFGVKPEHILGILGIETRWGANTGKFPLPGTLMAISQRVDSQGRPTRAAKQASRDLAALARLSATDNLGGLTPGQVRGSYAGAMGIPQFLPSSWEAYSRSPDGGKRDPFDFGTAAYSVGNYLRVHGYSKDVPRSIRSYNQSDVYVHDVLGLSANVKAGLDAAEKK